MVKKVTVGDAVVYNTEHGISIIYNLDRKKVGKVLATDEDLVSITSSNKSVVETLAKQHLRDGGDIYKIVLVPVSVKDKDTGPCKCLKLIGKNKKAGFYHFSTGGKCSVVYFSRSAKWYYLTRKDGKTNYNPTTTCPNCGNELGKPLDI